MYSAMGGDAILGEKPKGSNFIGVSEEGCGKPTKFRIPKGEGGFRWGVFAANSFLGWGGRRDNAHSLEKSTARGSAPIRHNTKDGFFFFRYVVGWWRW